MRVGFGALGYLFTGAAASKVAACLKGLMCGCLILLIVSREHGNIVSTKSPAWLVVTRK